MIRSIPARSDRSAPVPTLQVRCAADIASRQVEWLWPGKIALGKLSMIVGDPGLSKSTLTLCIAAHVSTGRAWPDGSSCPTGEAVLISAEDDPEDTVKPRLEASAAEASRIHFVDWLIDRDGTRRAFALDDVAALDRLLEAHPQVRVVVIDPITAFVGAIDSHKNSEVRGLLAPIAAVAAARRVAMLIVSHLNKGTALAAIHRPSGSLAFVAAARACFLVAPVDGEPEKRHLLCVKNNLGPGQDGLAYYIRVTDSGIPYVEWIPGHVALSADEALAPSSEDDRSAARECVDWLRDFLAAGPRSAKGIAAEAESLGFSRKVLRRAREKAGVKTNKQDFSCGWTWSL